jgi:cytochrome c-type biogenesis protein CcmH
MMRSLLILIFALSVSAGAAAPEKLTDPMAEARAVVLQKQLRCLVCQGESLDESNAPLAADLRRLIRERIAAGDSDEAVKRYLVARYGNFILMRPPLEGDTYVLWLSPLIALVVGSMVVVFVAWRARARWLNDAEYARPDHIIRKAPENS